MSHYSGHDFNLTAENDSWAHIYKYIQPHTAVLDIGCANGNFGAALQATKGCEVTGIDIDVNDLAIARSQLVHTHHLDITKDDISRLGKFDYILFADVLEHLPDPRSVLRRIKPLLKKDGKVIFSIPNMAHVSVRLDLLAGRFPYKDRGLLDKTHLHFYDKKEVESLFSDAGYKINSLHPTTVMPTLQTIQKQLSRLGLRGSKSFYDTLISSDASVFQYVGYATLTNMVSKINKREYVMPHDELRERIGDLEKQTSKLHKDNDNLREHINTISRRELIKKVINKHHKLV